MAVSSVYTTPPGVLCRAFFLDQPTGKGWSEVMWLAGQTTIGVSAQADAYAWVRRRSTLLAPGITVVRAMISVDGPFRDELPVAALDFVKDKSGGKLPPQYPQYWDHSAGFGIADVPWNVAKLSEFASAGLYVGHRQLSGVPDGITTNEAIDLTTKWGSLFDSYTRFLTGYSFDKGGDRNRDRRFPAGRYGFPVQLKPPDGTLWYTVTGCGFDSPGAGLANHLYVIAAGTPFGPDSLVRVGQVKGTGTLPNGTHNVYRVVGNKIYLDTPPGTLGSFYLRGGYIHALVRQVKPYYQVTLDDIGRRKRGAGFTRGDGRARTRSAVPSISQFK